MSWLQISKALKLAPAQAWEVRIGSIFTAISSNWWAWCFYFHLNKGWCHYVLQSKLSHSPGRDGRPGEFCIFFKLSSSGFVLGAGREVGDEAVPAAGRVKVKEDWLVGAFSVTESEAASREERKDDIVLPCLGILSSGISWSTGSSGPQDNSFRKASLQSQCSLFSRFHWGPKWISQMRKTKIKPKETNPLWGVKLIYIPYRSYPPRPC